MSLFRRLILLPAASLLTAAILSVLVGCAPTLLQHHQLAVLDKGIHPVQVRQRLEVPPELEGRVIADGLEYWVEVYRLRQGGMVSDYFLTYDHDRKLIYWGYADEYTRSSDPRLNEVMRALLAGRMER